MPYKKDNTHPLIKTLRKNGITTGENLSRILGVSPPTGRQKMNDPSKFTLGDLDKIMRFGHVPVDEIRTAICGREQK